jgi:PKD repeat protein
LNTNGVTSSTGSIYGCGPGNPVLYSSSTNAYIATGDILIAQGAGSTLHFKAKRAASYTGTGEVWVHMGGYCNFSLLSFPFDDNGWVQIGTFNPNTICSTFGPYTVPSDVIGGQKISYCIVPKNASSTNWVAIDDICVSEISGSAVATTMNEDFGTSASGWYPNTGVSDIPYHTYKNASDAYVILGAGADGGSDKAAYFYTGFDFCSTVSGTGIVTKEVNTSGYSNGEIRVEFKSKYPCSGATSYTFDENYQNYSPEIYVMQGADHGSNSWVQLPVNYYFADYSWRVASYDISAYKNANVRFKIERGGFCGTSMEAIDNVKIFDRNCAISQLTSGPISGTTAAVQNTNYIYTIPPVAGATYYKWYVRDGGTLYDAGPYIVSGQGTQSATINFNSLPGSGVRVLCIPFDTDPSLDPDACYAKIAYLGVTVSAVSPLVFDSVDTVHVTCNGNGDGSVTVNVSGGVPGYTYSWVPNVSSTNSASGLSGGNYQITVTDSNLDQIIANVTINEPVVLSSGLVPTASICQGDSVQLASLISGGTPPYSYTWTPASDISDAISAAPYVYPSIVGNTSYSLDVIDANGCTLSASSTIAVLPVPTANFIASDECLGTANCFVDISTTQAGGGAIATWTYDFGDASSLDMNQNPCHVYASDGTYSVQLLIETTDGCKDSMTIPVTVYALPIPSFSADLTSGCDPLVVNYASTSVGASTCDWDFGDGNVFTGCSGVSNTYVSSGLYTVELIVTDGNGCTDNLILTDYIQVFITPSVDAGADSTICQGDSLVLAAINPDAGALSWNNGVIDGVAFIPLNGGYYTVQSTTINGCAAVDSLLITLLPSPTVSLGADITSCELSVTLDAGSGMDAYSWSTSESTQTVLVNNSGSYWVMVDSSGCSNSDTIDVLLIDCSGIADVELANIRVYPNPAKDIITLIGLSPESEIQIKDLNGRVVSRAISQGFTHSLDVVSLANGTYLLEVQSHSGLKTIKFIKE